MEAMLIIVGLMTLAGGGMTAEHMTFENPEMPITRIEYSYGKGGEARVEHLEAVIQNHHLTSATRMNFSPVGSIEQFYQNNKQPGDERGHLVPAQFSGPADWYNISPQNARVNRNMGYQAISTEWFDAECEVRRFLEGGSYRRVYWTVNMTYVGDSNRPEVYYLTVRFEEPCRTAGSDINIAIRNSPQQQDSTYHICRQCHKNCERDTNICKAARLNNPHQ